MINDFKKSTGEKDVKESKISTITNKVVKKTKTGFNKAKGKINEWGKKDISYKLRVPRYIAIVVIPAVIFYIILLISERGMRFDLVSGVVGVFTLGMVIVYKIDVFNMDKVIGYTEDGEAIYELTGWKWGVDPSWNPPTVVENTALYVGLFIFAGLAAYGVIVAFKAIFGDSKRTTALVNTIAGKEVANYNKKNIKLTKEVKNKIEITVKEKVMNTAFYKEAMLLDKQIKVWHVVLVLPAVYIVIKKWAFKPSFIINEFQIYWEDNVQNVIDYKEEKIDNKDIENKEEEKVVV